jgi:hypothetical protein
LKVKDNKNAGRKGRRTKAITHDNTEIEKDHSKNHLFSFFQIPESFHQSRKKEREISKKEKQQE